MSETTQTNGTTPKTEVLPEAPASASAKMTSPNGIEWLLTARDFTVNGLLQKIQVMEQHLLGDGWTPATNGHAPRHDAATGESAPVCKHHGPMKKSQYKGWYCPHKNADGSYCKETVK